MGRAKVTTPLTVYAHLINTDDHASNTAALGALATRSTLSYTGNVVAIKKPPYLHRGRAGRCGS
jgi:hypothetical protein